MSDRKRSISKNLSFLLVASVIGFSVATPVSPAYSAQEACPFPVDEVVVEDPAPLWVWCAKAFTGVDVMWLPLMALLATENLITNELTLGTVSPDRVLTGHSVGADLEALRPTGTHGQYQTGYLYRGGFEHTRASGDQFIGQFDPGAGYGLGVPGSLGGPSGAFLPAHPQNIVENMRYNGNLGWSAGFFNVERRYEADDHAFGFFAGKMFSGLELDESVTADIPGFLSTFSYDTEIETRAYGSHVGARGRRDIFQPIKGTWQTQISGRSEVGVAYIDSTLRDHTTFTGFISGAVPNSQIVVEDSGWGAYGSVGGALSLTNKNNKAQFFVDAQYEWRPWFGSAYRDGTNPTRFQRSHAEVFSARIGVRAQF